MSPEEFRATYDAAWDSFYSPEHLETILRRTEASGRSARKLARKAFYFYACQAVEGVHPLQGGIFRRKVRADIFNKPVNSSKLGSSSRKSSPIISRIRWVILSVLACG